MLPYSIYQKGRYRVVKIDEDVMFNTDISELNIVIRDMLDQGKRTIAVCFKPISMLNTKAVADFVQCIEMISNSKGELAVVSPSKYIRGFLHAIDFDHVVKVCNDEEELEQEEIASI